MEIKHQIREAMDRAQLSVRDVSRAVGVCNQSVRSWLDGTRSPRRRHLPALERVLKTRIDMSAGLSVHLPHSEDLIALAYPEIRAFAGLPPSARDGLLQTVTGPELRCQSWRGSLEHPAGGESIVTFRPTNPAHDDDEHPRRLRSSSSCITRAIRARDPHPECRISYLFHTAKQNATRRWRLCLIGWWVIHGSNM
jgi:hypothetical protein